MWIHVGYRLFCSKLMNMGLMATCTNAFVKLEHSKPQADEHVQTMMNKLPAVVSAYFVDPDVLNLTTPISTSIKSGFVTLFSKRSH